MIYGYQSIIICSQTFCVVGVLRGHFFPISPPLLYLSGEVDVQCLPDAFYDVIIGNVQGARPADDPDPSWQETWRAHAA